jgi:hypothetical protein
MYLPYRVNNKSNRKVKVMKWDHKLDEGFFTQCSSSFAGSQGKA